MKAVNYAAPFKVEVQDVPIPGIEHPDDVIVKVTTAAICGSDLHMYEGRTGAEPGITICHKFRLKCLVQANNSHQASLSVMRTWVLSKRWAPV